MSGKYALGLLMVLFAFALSYSSAALVGIASIRAPAVVLSNNTGSLTNFTLTITNGTGNVMVTGPQIVGASTLQSAQTAAKYASNYTNNNFSKYNFNYSITNAGSNVSGPSAGAAMTILAISAFSHRQLRNDFTMTGTISPNGAIGPIGGVYDKVNASHNAGMKLVLVPAVPGSSQEDELYYLVQTNFQIPLVQVANVSQAAYFAFNPQINGTANETGYSFYNNYDVASLPESSINCTGSCNYTLFSKLLNATYNLDRGEINNLSSDPRFLNVTIQLNDALNQSIAIGSKNYLYTSADLAFLNYVSAYFFNGYSTNRPDALDKLDNIQSFCNSLSPPLLTTTNYDYVISAELRQGWGNYTINQTIGAYNLSQVDSDQILGSLYLGAQANGWCTAANLVYNEAASSGNNYVISSSALKSVALERISSALTYGPSLYLATAQAAFRQNNYPVAILDSDYAIAFGTAAASSNLSVQVLDNKSLAIINNSTYGVWATEFSKEAFFYVTESRLTGNATLAKTYAESGYSVALLAQHISNDTAIISQNLVPESQQQVQQSQNVASNQKALNYLAYSQLIILVLIVIIFALLILIVILLIIIMGNISNHNTSHNKQRRQNRK